MQTNITFITTVNHNIGDDFVREGLQYLFRQKFPDRQFQFHNIHKHAPITSRFGFENLKNYRKQKKLDSYLPLWLSRDRILDADIVVQSGAPVYWCHEDVGSHCYQNEWFGPLIRRRFSKNSRAVLLNIAGGTCQKYYSDGNDFCDACTAYIREFHDKSGITSVRDSLAGEVLHKLNLQAPVIPCSSIFAIDEHNIEPAAGEYVVLNYMKAGGHYTFNQNIDALKWQDTFRRFYFEIRERYPVVFCCHNKKEIQQTSELDPHADIFYAEKNYLEYIKFYSKAKFGIGNRVHGSFMMASLGKPAFVIGNDTRALMVEKIGLQSAFVNDVNVDILLQQYEHLANGADDFQNRFAVIKKNAFSEYMQLLDLDL